MPQNTNQSRNSNRSRRKPAKGSHPFNKSPRASSNTTHPAGNSQSRKKKHHRGQGPKRNPMHQHNPGQHPATANGDNTTTRDNTAPHDNTAPRESSSQQQETILSDTTPLPPFTSLGLAPQLLRAIRDEGYDTPTPIQAGAIPHAIENRDILGCAQTGTGKTAAFALPILHKLIEEGVPNEKGRHYPRALILCPTRELAGQITDSFNTYGRHTRLHHTAIYGGVKQFHQEKALRRGVDILVATPGRLIDLLEQGILDLTEVDTLVLDEADRMLDMGFIDPIRRIAAAIHPDRQTLFFSATMPKEIRSLANTLLNDPVTVTVSPVASLAPKIDQSVYMVGREQKQSLLHHLIDEHNITRTLVFTRTKHGADKVTKKLNNAGIRADSIHGNKSQNQRQRALDGFKAGKSHVLVATDVAARGLDIDDITHVFNFDLPHEPEAYVHRIGRTGRAGATGQAIAFCDRSERSLLRQIERLTGNKIDATTDLPDLPKPELKPKPESRQENNTGEARASYADRATEKPYPAKRRSEPGGRYNPNKSRNQNSRKPAGRGRSHPRSR